MTSKALEAAMQADWELTREPYDPPNVADADPWYRDDLRKKIVFIIRAFAQNISKEAVHLRGVDYCRACDRHMTGDLFGVEAVRAAIEKDLE